MAQNSVELDVSGNQHVSVEEMGGEKQVGSRRFRPGKALQP
jgi:hypothetical protein